MDKELEILWLKVFCLELNCMAYKCAKCSTEVTNVSEGLVRCPSCGHRVLYKTREPISKTIKTD